MTQPRLHHWAASLSLVGLLMGGCNLSAGNDNSVSPTPTPRVSPSPQLISVAFSFCQNSLGIATVTSSVPNGLNRDSFVASLNGVPITDPSAVDSSANFQNGSTQFTVTYRLTPPVLNATGFNLFRVSFADLVGQIFQGESTRTCTSSLASPSPSPTSSPSPSPSPTSSPSPTPAPTPTAIPTPGGSVTLAPAGGGTVLATLAISIPGGLKASSLQVLLNGSNNVTPKVTGISEGSAQINTAFVLVPADGLVTGSNTLTVLFSDSTTSVYAFTGSIVL